MQTLTKNELRKSTKILLHNFSKIGSQTNIYMFLSNIDEKIALMLKKQMYDIILDENEFDRYDVSSSLTSLVYTGMVSMKPFTKNTIITIYTIEDILKKLFIYLSTTDFIVTAFQIIYEIEYNPI